MRKIQFADNYFYHIYNRGTEKRKIFLDEKDYPRFIHGLYEFNNDGPVLNAGFRFSQIKNYGNQVSIIRPQKERMVDIISFCLMPNHFHFILKQLKENGIARFMQKLGTSYTMYFNKKYKRNGVLYQGKFKAILIDKDEYFLPLTNYIHFNPIEIIEPGWKEKGIKNWQKVNEFLLNYRWSSLSDYNGIKNFPSVISKDFLLSYFPDEKKYKEYLMSYLTGYSKNIEEIKID